MKTVRFENDLDWKNVATLKAGVDYVVEDFSLAQLAELSDGGMEVHSNEIPREIGAFGRDRKNLYIIFGGGHGDLLLLTPVLRNLKEHWPDLEITVCCFKNHHFLLKGNPNVAHLTEYPPRETELQFYQNKISGMVVSSPSLAFGPDIKTKHACDLFNAGLPELKSRKLDYKHDEILASNIAIMMPKKKKYRVGIQFNTGFRARTWPLQHFYNLMTMLLQAGIEVMCVGHPKQLQFQYEDIFKERAEQFWNLTDLAFTMEESVAAVAATCDLVVAPDSFFAHLANALDIPLVCIMGSFDPAMRRTPGHFFSHYFDGRKACPLAPCFHHGKKGQPWPAGGPCNATKQCDALNAIDAMTVHGKVIEVLNQL